MSRFIKETFPKKWCIKYHEIVHDYFLENNPGYIYSRPHIWYHSDNLFFGNRWVNNTEPDTDHTIITLNEFKEFVLMKEFILPEKYYVKSINFDQNVVLTNYFNHLHEGDIGPGDVNVNNGVYYYSEIIDGIWWYVGKNRSDSSFQEITYEQFVKYVLNQNTNSEDMSTLINLLKQITC